MRDDIDLIDAFRYTYLGLSPGYQMLKDMKYSSEFKKEGIEMGHAQLKNRMYTQEARLLYEKTLLTMFDYFEHKEKVFKYYSYTILPYPKGLDEQTIKSLMHALKRFRRKNYFKNLQVNRLQFKQGYLRLNGIRLEQLLLDLYGYMGEPKYLDPRYLIDPSSYTNYFEQQKMLIKDMLSILNGTEQTKATKEPEHWLIKKAKEQGE